MRIRLHILPIDKKVWWTLSQEALSDTITKLISDVQQEFAWRDGALQAQLDDFELLSSQKVGSILHADELVVLHALDCNERSINPNFVPPGYGTNATYRRNQRRRAAKLDLHTPSITSYDRDDSSKPEVRTSKKRRHEIYDERPWQDKLRLSALECEDESFEVEVPPFPFAQPELVRDLPPLPEDLNELQAALEPIEVGTVIAFKLLAMNASYQPCITDYRTARVLKTSVKGYHLELAKRDRSRDLTPGKFAAPGNPPESTEELLVEFKDMIDPKHVPL